MERTDIPFPHQLAENEIFVFNTNAASDHSSGSAGIAIRGDWRPDGKDDESFQNLLASHSSEQPATGKWARYGQLQGPSKGVEGKSYAIQTTDGKARSFPLRDGSAWIPGKWMSDLTDISTQLVRLCAFAREKAPDATFLVPELGCGASGYQPEDFNALWEELDVPENIKFVNIKRD